MRRAGSPYTLPDLAAGHVHAYERTFQVLDYTLDGCAPRWLTMGARLPSPTSVLSCDVAAGSIECVRIQHHRMGLVQCACWSLTRRHALSHAGDGGNIEGLYKQFAATNCSCPQGTSNTVCPCANVPENLSPKCAPLETPLTWLGPSVCLFSCAPDSVDAAPLATVPRSPPRLVCSVRH